jgi:hypothetical protein
LGTKNKNNKQRYEPPKIYEIETDMTQAMGQSLCNPGHFAGGPCDRGAAAGTQCFHGHTADGTCTHGPRIGREPPPGWEP